MQKGEKIYRVTRDDTYTHFDSSPLVSVVPRRAVIAMIKSARAYPRYTILKIEEATVEEWKKISEGDFDTKES